MVKMVRSLNVWTCLIIDMKFVKPDWFMSSLAFNMLISRMVAFPSFFSAWQSLESAERCPFNK